jgi:hypothetical protein
VKPLKGFKQPNSLDLTFRTAVPTDEPSENLCTRLILSFRATKNSSILHFAASIQTTLYLCGDTLLETKARAICEIKSRP